jgi:hypothetical protein
MVAAVMSLIMVMIVIVWLRRQDERRRFCAGLGFVIAA